MVTVNNLSVKINNSFSLKAISCSLQPGRITMFIGKSGAGKTTLLKSLVGLMPIANGQIIINNKTLADMISRERSETIGYVFQDFNLFPHLTVLENCIDPLLVRGMAYQQAQLQVVELLEELEIKSFADKYPSELSGGQQQRVAIARCLCLKPQVILLDEPTASLDPFNAEVLITVLQRLAAQRMVIGLSSQDMSFARKIFDRVYYMQEGTIAEFCEDVTKLDETKKIKQFMFNL